MFAGAIASAQAELVSSTINTPVGLTTARGYAHKGLAASHATNVCMVTHSSRRRARARRNPKVGLYNFARTAVVCGDGLAGVACSCNA